MAFVNKYKVITDYAEIYVKQRSGKLHVVTVDMPDLKKIITFDHSIHIQWNERGKAYYPHITIYKGIKNGVAKYENIKLTTFLLGKETELRIDHIDNDTLNTRRYNLRIITHGNNLRNRKGKNITNTSGYRNVSWISGYWRVQLQIDGKNYMFPEKFDDVDKAGKFGEQIHYSKTIYDRDMFMAELKGKLFIAQNKGE